MQTTYPDDQDKLFQDLQSVICRAYRREEENQLFQWRI